VSGVINPATSSEDPALNTDFEIRLGNTAGTVISIDLRPSDMVTVQTVLDRINAQAADQLTAAGLPTTSLTAGLAGDGNGLTLTQNTAFTSPMVVTSRNNSPAAEQLGLSGATYDSSTAQLRGEDRAKVRVDSLFSDLIDLREGLARNQISGISFAGEKLESTIGHVAEVRGVVGGHAQRVEAALSRASEQTLVDTTIRSELQDVDFTQAASRFSLLQVQLEAGLRTTALASQRSLLDFLG
jgi:flagellin-like hook-associated protein FlgL